MRYVLMFCHEGEQDVAPADVAVMPRFQAWERLLRERGVRNHGMLLADASETVTVRVRDGRTLVTDGPFAETREQVAGVEIVDCADLDEAMLVATAHPGGDGTVEIRPFWEG